MVSLNVIPAYSKSKATKQMVQSGQRRGTSIKYLYTIEEGVCEEENYGMSVAQMAGLDEGIVERARQISQGVCVASLIVYGKVFTISTKKLNNGTQETTRTEDDETKRHEAMVKRLVQAVELWSGTEEDGLRVYLKGLYNEFSHHQQ